MPKRKNKTVLGVIGVILTIFGFLMTIPFYLNQEYIFLPFTLLSVVIGVILMALAVSD